MKEEHDGKNGMESWQEPVNWSLEMDRLTHDELLRSRRFLNAAVKLDPDDAPSLTARGLTRASLEQYELAVSDLHQGHRA
jgi:regulator of sirC expression with transglutaminase-like and TPR domain